MTSVNERLAALRAAMTEHVVAACIVTNSDPHHSEYSGPHWLAREHFSGFTGSAGDLVVCLDGGGLWTDGRYFLQAEQQLAGTGIELFKQRVAGTPSIPEWLAATLAPVSRVAVAGASINVAFHTELVTAARDAKLTVVTDLDLVTATWDERPPSASAQVFDFPLEFAGVDTPTKLTQLRAQLAAAETEALLLSTLPDIAWLLNLRGADVPFCPLFESFVYVSAERCVLCVNPAKLPGPIATRLAHCGVEVHTYEGAAALLQQAPTSLSLCPQSTNSELYKAVPASTRVVLKAPPTTLAKACKNPTELAAMREALRYDGVAMVRFARWLDNNVAAGEVTELEAERVLGELRAQLPNYVSASFHTIAGYGDHGALMHYAATSGTDRVVGDESFFLVDSGGQYLGGTTDITRTFLFGEPSAAQRADYTTVLQAVIRLTRTQFKQGARGCNLDVMARGVLWQLGLDYDSGTGHGVGQCLVVHEGPQGFSQRLEDQALLPGMVITNEPGIYRPGEYGIRIENILEVVPAQSTAFGEFYRFETITLAPIQTRALDVARLTADEIAWLNAYHGDVYEQLAELLEPADAQWLRDACAPLTPASG